MAGSVILSAQVANSGRLFADICRLHFRDGWRIWDATYGRGVFWSEVDLPKVASDISLMSGIDLVADALNPPFRESVFDAAVFDPPYFLLGGEPRDYQKFYNVHLRTGKGREYVLSMYRRFLDAVPRVLRPGGLVVVKCMNQVESGKLWPITYYVIRDALDRGYKLLDWLINVSKSARMRHPYQCHSRRNYSDWLIFKKGGC